MSPINRAGSDLGEQNHTCAFHGNEAHSDRKVFSYPGSRKGSVQTINWYLSHLNPANEALLYEVNQLFSSSRQIQPGIGKIDRLKQYKARKLTPVSRATVKGQPWISFSRCHPVSVSLVWENLVKMGRQKQNLAPHLTWMLLQVYSVKQLQLSQRKMGVV